VGRAKNSDENPIAEKDTVSELENEMMRLDPSGSSLTPVSFALAPRSLIQESATEACLLVKCSFEKLPAFK